jgi:hypothetical protein
MFIMYVDESGDSGMVGSPTRYFIPDFALGAVS